MLTPIAISLILSSLTLTLALGLLILLLWHDPQQPSNLYFAWFLRMVVLWSGGSVLGRGAAFAGVESTFVSTGLGMLELGFIEAALALFLYVIALMGVQRRNFLLISLIATGGMAAYYLFRALLGGQTAYVVTTTGLLRFNFSLATLAIIATLSIGTLALVWQAFRKIQQPTLVFGVMLFSLGQLSALMSPRLRALAVAEDVAAIATLVMALAVVQTQIVQPLAGRTRQIRVVRDVGLAVTSRLRLQNVLETIAAQAAALLGANASLIFLRQDGDASMILAAQYNIHEDLLGLRLPANEGLTGKVAQERRPYRLADYRREWKGMPDTPFAEEGFGSVVAVPFTFADSVVGVLLVINGVDNRLFTSEDVRLLELLAPQAAVAITNSRLFEQERALTSEVEVAKTRLEAFLLSTDNPVVAVNKKMEVIFANEAAAALITDSPELQGRSLLDLIPLTYLPAAPRDMLRDLKNHKSHVYELTIEEHTYLCHLTRIREPEAGWVAVLNDVSSLKELDRLQRQMIELTSHQLKNPLQGAMLHLDELEDIGQDVLTPEMRHDLDIIGQQMDRMNKLIEGILSLERLQSRSINRKEKLDFAQVVESAVNHLRELAQAKKITLELSLSPNLPPIQGNPEELAEAVSNLVDNAIKYTPESGTIQVDTSADDGRVLLKVCDTGLGIPAEAQGRVFDRFFRAGQSGTESISGSGMGLSLVKAIIESHKGRIWLESESGSGTTFYVSLPAMN
jgi:signal transduction histidine kinase